MRYLVDTNVVVNYLEDTAEKIEDICVDSMVMKLAFTGKFQAYVSASAVTDILYLFTRDLKAGNRLKPSEEQLSNSKIQELARKNVELLLTKLKVLEVTEQTIKDAFSSDWKDAEDAVQYFAAKAGALDGIITWNTKDYKKSEISIYDPNVFNAVFPTIQDGIQ